MKSISYRNFVCLKGIHVTHVIIDGANDIEDTERHGCIPSAKVIFNSSKKSPLLVGLQDTSDCV